MVPSDQDLEGQEKERRKRKEEKQENRHLSSFEKSYLISRNPPNSTIITYILWRRKLKYRELKYRPGRMEPKPGGLESPYSIH